MTGNHVPARLLASYVRGEDLAADQAWAVEAHLESCPDCRARLAGISAPEVTSLAGSVWSGIEPSLTPQAHPSRVKQWLVTWVTPVAMPWLVMIVLVTLLACWFDEVSGSSVSLVRLFAPVLPVAGVAASWARGIDPAYELVAATPRAGLYLVLRRTTAMLAVLLPLLLGAGWATGTHGGWWLLPSLAFTTGTLALGAVIGIGRAAVLLIAAWVAVIVLPTVSLQRQAFVLAPGTLPVWAGIFAATALVVFLRRTAFTRLGANN
ncbi:zf-HC2 domain-containing protein [Amycolatopsis acidicola]|uniref:Zf-HC2 domain-containing protein n=1 Tax=Amycolatopsis acidicola TaxID=2596893 RepID=A0A5N0UXW9_9PSEU|nr:zf-HC2 domain-containing protein [Amycolatopsis acidicola]KAA9156313.1 zf-HC2 domain-containing protein [Amycolatopsis acidicola]